MADAPRFPSSERRKCEGKTASETEGSRPKASPSSASAGGDVPGPGPGPAPAESGSESERPEGATTAKVAGVASGDGDDDEPPNTTGDEETGTTGVVGDGGRRSLPAPATLPPHLAPSGPLEALRRKIRTAQRLLRPACDLERSRSPPAVNVKGGDDAPSGATEKLTTVPMFSDVGPVVGETVARTKDEGERMGEHQANDSQAFAALMDERAQAEVADQSTGNEKKKQKKRSGTGGEGGESSSGKKRKRHEENEERSMDGHDHHVDNRSGVSTVDVVDGRVEFSDGGGRGEDGREGSSSQRRREERRRRHSRRLRRSESSGDGESGSDDSVLSENHQYGPSSPHITQGRYGYASPHGGYYWSGSSWVWAPADAPPWSFYAPSQLSPGSAPNPPAQAPEDGADHEESSSTILPSPSPPERRPRPPSPASRRRRLEIERAAKAAHTQTERDEERRRMEARVRRQQMRLSREPAPPPPPSDDDDDDDSPQWCAGINPTFLESRLPPTRTRPPEVAARCVRGFYRLVAGARSTTTSDRTEGTHDEADSAAGVVGVVPGYGGKGWIVDDEGGSVALRAPDCRWRTTVRSTEAATSVPRGKDDDICDRCRKNLNGNFYKLLRRQADKCEKSFDMGTMTLAQLREEVENQSRLIRNHDGKISRLRKKYDRLLQERNRFTNPRWEENEREAKETEQEKDNRRYVST